ncbi:MAG TPA: thioesterase domain-containing protein [Myxococcales bacterium]|nr:thioesterase domain-containing protein [Myxococcales bacterium]
MSHPLFLVHPVSGTVECYAELAPQLGRDRPLVALQAPGLAPGEECVPSIPGLAQRHLDAVRRAQPAGPYLIGGWSVGGVVAFEMAQQLRSAGERAALLLLIDCRVPDERMKAGNRKALGAFEDETIARHFLQYLVRRNEADPPPSLDHLRGLARPELMAAVAEQARRLDASCRSLDTEQIERRFEVYRSNLRALLGYEPRRYEGRAALLQASEEHPAHPRPATLGWEDFIAQGIEYHPVGGTHFTLTASRYVPALAGVIQGCLSRAQEPQEPLEQR